MNTDCSCLGRGYFVADITGESFIACTTCNTHEIWAGMPRQKVTPAHEIGQVTAGMVSELMDARIKWPPFNSAHEAYGVLLEEVDELWDHVKTNQKCRDLPAMRKEALQVAAMALRFALDVCDETRGRK